MESDPVARAWRGALRRVRATTGVTLAFGGPIRQGEIAVDYVDGNRTGSLGGLAVRPGRGLGGRAWVEGRACGVVEYAAARTISHDYDPHVLPEGVRALVAVPVPSPRGVRGVVYAGVRETVGYGDQLLDSLNSLTRRLGRELMIEDEVERRVSAQLDEIQRSEAALTERMRRAYADLMAWRSSTDDPVVQAQVDAVLGDLGDDAPPALVSLTDRELQVLAQAATGAAYPEIGLRLGLSAQTVKSYMRDLIGRLGAHNRHEAMVDARRQGLLP
jgi:DNA-binding CsgD family transcriptional regulator